MALAARTAAELEAGSGIATSTIDRLLIDADRTPGYLSAHNVVVGDEGRWSTPAP